jgi:hypothetical protein
MSILGCCRRPLGQGIVPGIVSTTMNNHRALFGDVLMFYDIRGSEDLLSIHGRYYSGAVFVMSLESHMSCEESR